MELCTSIIKLKNDFYVKSRKVWVRNYYCDPFCYPVCGQNFIYNNCTILLSNFLLFYWASPCLRIVAFPISFLQYSLLLVAGAQSSTRRKRMANCHFYLISIPFYILLPKFQNSSVLTRSGCEPHVQHPTWRARVSVFVRHLAPNLSGMCGTTKSIVPSASTRSVKKGSKELSVFCSDTNLF
jgi:hypothetical protein